MALTVDGSGSRVERNTQPAEAPRAETTGPKPAEKAEAAAAPAPAADSFKTQPNQVANPPIDLGGTGPANGAPQHGNPDINVKDSQGATYQDLHGVPFIQGQGDAKAVDPNDVSQGGIGDCYYMSSLATIAQQHPEVIQNAIKQNDDGTYTVSLYEKRPWYQPWGPEFTKKEINITPELPARDGNAIFAHTGDETNGQKELWVGLMEKAFAKEHGSYKSIEGGWGNEAMEALTGKSSDTYSPGKMNIQQLADLHTQGKGITVSSAADYKLGPIDLPDTVSRNPLYKNGTLVANHEYWISDVDTKNNTVTLRNPWGYEPGITLPFDQFQGAFRQVSTNPLN